MSDVPSSDAVFSPLVERAVELASQWHDRTYRKGSWRASAFEPPTDEEVQVPVMAHLATVALVVQRAGWSDPVVAAAYLHDVLEDRNRYGQRLRREALRDAVAPEVERLVVAVSERKLDAKGKRRPWRARKEGYIDKLMAASPEAVAISLSDKFHNLWSINESLAAGENVFASGPHRTALSAGPKQQHWFHRTVMEVSTRYDDPRLDPIRSRLRREVERFERWMEGAS